MTDHAAQRPSSSLVREMWVHPRTVGQLRLYASPSSDRPGSFVLDAAFAGVPIYTDCRLMVGTIQYERGQGAHSCAEFPCGAALSEKGSGTP